MVADRDERNAQAAVLFADISGSSQLYVQLGDTAAKDLIGRTLEILSKISRDRRGTVIKTIGDEVMCRFPSADDGYDAAVQMHRSLQSSPPSTSPRIGVRLGFHWGDVLLSEGDVFGDAVNVAARLTAIAKRDQIVTSEQTIEALTGPRKGAAHQFDRVAVKGRVGEIAMWMVDWDEKEDSTVMRTTAFMTKSVDRQLQLSCAERSLMLATEGKSVSLGRAAECSLVVPSNFASRLHARVVVRRGKFVLIDESTNGTYVVAGALAPGAAEVFIKREELVLPEKGVLSLGHSCHSADVQLVNFRASTA